MRYASALFLMLLALSVCARHARAEDLCISCHTQREIDLMPNPLQYRSSIYEEKHAACPALRKIKVDMFLTESAIVKTREAIGKFEKNPGRSEPMKELDTDFMRLEEIKENLGNSGSVGLITGELDGIRADVNRLYRGLNAERDGLGIKKAMGAGLAALGIFLVVLIISSGGKREKIK